MEPPLYDINRTWAENIRSGPNYSGPVYDRPPLNPSRWVDFLGFKVASPLGVPAGPLLDSRWTTLAARLGYDIVTYKTIRSQPSDGHGLPNVLYVNAAADALPAGEPVQVSPGAPQDSTAVAITNSFGMPSLGREALMADIPAAQAGLGPGQVLVVSVTGTPNRPDGVDFVSDFVEAAQLAVEAGAQILEANLSCPNVGSHQGVLYSDPDAVAAVTERLRSAFPGVPLILKVGAFSSREECAAVLRAAAGAGANAISGINGLSRRVVSSDGVTPALGPDRPTSGICGAPIRQAALEFVRTARQIIQEDGLGLTLIGVGGITTAQHAVDLLAAGADVVQSATGMMWNPRLAQEFHELYTGQLPVEGAAGDVAAAGVEEMVGDVEDAPAAGAAAAGCAGAGRGLKEGAVCVPAISGGAAGAQPQQEAVGRCKVGAVAGTGAAQLDAQPAGRDQVHHVEVV